MRDNRRPVKDFESVFHAKIKQVDTVILVGGHTVNVRALSCKGKLGDLLIPFEPLASGDIDVFAKGVKFWAGLLFHCFVFGQLVLPRDLSTMPEQPSIRGRRGQLMVQQTVNLWSYRHHLHVR